MTATATQIRSNGSADSTAQPTWAPSWEQRKQPVKFDFAAGAYIMGILLSVEPMNVRDKKTGTAKRVMRYTVQPVEDGTPTPEGDPVFFFGTIQLDNVLRPNDVGHLINVRCTGEDTTAGRNGNAMKLFDVLVDKNTAPGWAHDSTPIVDGDLPDEAFMA